MLNFLQALPKKINVISKLENKIKKKTINDIKKTSQKMTSLSVVWLKIGINLKKDFISLEK